MVINVLLADDHGVLRDGVRRLLEAHADIRVTAMAQDAREALEQAVAVQPDVALLDIAMPGLSGIELARRMSTAVPRTAVVILSMHSSPDLMRAALRAGARGFVLKESAGEEVVRAVRTVRAGRRFLGDKVADALVDGLQSPRPRLDDLTARERDVLRLITEGNSNAETAAILGLSTRSVETYRLRLMQKLGLSDLPSLVKFALQHGLITLGSPTRCGY